MSNILHQYAVNMEHKKHAARNLLEFAKAANLPMKTVPFPIGSNELDMFKDVDVKYIFGKDGEIVGFYTTICTSIRSIPLYDFVEVHAPDTDLDFSMCSVVSMVNETDAEKATREFCVSMKSERRRTMPVRLDRALLKKDAQPHKLMRAAVDTIEGLNTLKKLPGTLNAAQTVFRTLCEYRGRVFILSTEANYTTERYDDGCMGISSVIVDMSFIVEYLECDTDLIKGILRDLVTELVKINVPDQISFTDCRVVTDIPVETFSVEKVETDPRPMPPLMKDEVFIAPVEKKRGWFSRLFG